MAIKKKPGSITESADKNKINISEVSNVNKTISTMQKNIQRDLNEIDQEIGQQEAISEVQNSMRKVLFAMSGAVADIGKGFAGIAQETAKSSSEAIKQYGRAVTQDININKQNLLSLTLAKSTPIFGYFAAKFMETDVFKNATERMKSNIGQALGSVATKFKEGVGSLFKKGKEKNTTGKTISSISGIDEKVPKMAKGGYVEKGGLAHIHPAEVVMPIDKILDRIDESISITKDLADVTKQTQLNSITKMSTYISSTDKLYKFGLFKGFVKAYASVHNRYNEPSNQRMLRAVLAIQDTLGATVGAWQQVYQKMLVEHPTFRNIIFMAKSIKGLLKFFTWNPLYQVFKSRGGYKAKLSQTGRPFDDIATNLGLIYTGSMWRLDTISVYTKATAEAIRDLSSFITGTKYSPLNPASTREWSIAGKALKGFGFIGGTLLPKLTMPLIGGLLFGKKGFQKGQGLANFLVEHLNNSASQEIKNGFTGLLNLFKKAPLLLPEKKSTITVAMDTANQIPLNVIDNKLLEMEKQRSKEMEELIGYTVDMKKIDENTYGVINRMDNREQRRSIFGFLGGFGGFAKNILGMLSGGGIFGLLKNLLGFGAGGGLLSGLFGGGGLIKNLLGSGGGLIKNLLGSGGGLIKNLFGGTSNLVTKGAKIIGSMMTAAIPTITSALTGVLSSPILWAAGAAALGAAIGVGIDRLLGISEKFKSWIDEHGQRSNVISKEVSTIQKEHFTAAKKRGGQEGYKGFLTTKLMAGHGLTLNERMRDIGYWGRTYIDGINAAQQKYMLSNLDRYLQYSPDEITRIRSEWLKGGGYVPKAIGDDHIEYGKKREDAFLYYLEKKGNKLTDVDRQKLYENYQEKFTMYRPITGNLDIIKDKTIGVIVDGQKIVAEKVIELSAATKELKDTMVQAGEKYYKGSAEMARGVTAGISTISNNVANSVSSSVQNITNVRGSGVSNHFSDFSNHIMRGEVFED